MFNFILIFIIFLVTLIVMISLCVSERRKIERHEQNIELLNKAKRKLDAMERSMRRHRILK